MSTPALIMMISVQLLFTGMTGYFFWLALRKPTSKTKTPDHT